MSVVVENITKLYGDQKALDNLSFEVQKGEILGFLGPNGAGKTTTMKILSCFIPQSSGEAFVEGFDVNKKPMEVKKCLGYLPEHNPLYKDMYVREYLNMVARLHKIRKPKIRIEELIETTGLSLEANKKINSLSKGYRQRVGLAQAIIHDPKVLILDEPTSGLDPNQLIEIRQLIRNLGQDKIVIFSSHIMQEVEALCDRVLILNHGKLVADDRIENLANRISGSACLKVSFEKPIDEAYFDSHQNIDSWVKNQNVYQINFSESKNMSADIFDFAVKHSNRITFLQEEDASVEEVFQRLTKQSN